ncbi:hypothetical protein J2W37_001265 [Variovorax paradoxus]|uniref:hypothetical protein n=1 Tax=Variovorax paradoxus TaxID=34073 RepID=UPI0027819174|nr:hypothetical protein [Variovorax paradoxus]MDP9963554.1 hypothetical protein [Variovorax paradoxus]
MEEPLIEYWTPEECAAGVCTELEIGKLKPPMVEARRLAQRATPKAVKALIDVIEQGEDLQAKVKAAQALLDRGWGKPDQHVTSNNVHAFPEMPWITAQRHAYRLGADAAKLIETGLAAVTDATPKAAPSVETAHDDPALPEAGRSGFPGE